MREQLRPGSVGKCGLNLGRGGEEISLTSNKVNYPFRSEVTKHMGEKMNLVKKCFKGAIGVGVLSLWFCLVDARADPVLTFDQVHNGGSLTYDGEGGPVIGTDILFENIIGTDTPLNDGVVLTCTGCELSFTSGANLAEPGDNPFIDYAWAGAGSFLVTGSAFNGVTLVASGTLLQGSWDTNNPLGNIGEEGELILSGAGSDSKHADLMNFYGLSSDFRFASTNISIQPTFGANHSFSGVVDEADIANRSVPGGGGGGNPVPEPNSLFLLGMGLIGIGSFARRRLVKR
jgi:hypothetical protein